jgi:hypothetical protein
MTYLRTCAIIAILQILPYYNAFGQTVEQMLIGNDTVFLMDRAFAELVAERFDSLEVLKRYKTESDTIVSNLQHAIHERSVLIQAQQTRIDNLRGENSVLYQQIESYKRTDNISETLRKQLKAETRKRKTWQYTTAGVAIGGIISSIYLITR